MDRPTRLEPQPEHLHLLRPFPLALLGQGERGRGRCQVSSGSLGRVASHPRRGRRRGSWIGGTGRHGGFVRARFFWFGGELCPCEYDESYAYITHTAGMHKYSTSS